MRTIKLVMNEDWFIPQNGRINLGYQGESGSVLEIECADKLSSAYNYYLDIDKDTIYVAPDFKNNKLVVDLDSAILGKAGSKALQLRASNEDECRKSNVVYAYLTDAMNSECRYPNGLPTEFAQYENKIRGIIADQQESIIARVDELVEEKLPELVEDHLEEVVRPITQDVIEEVVPGMIGAAIDAVVPDMVDEAVAEAVKKNTVDPRSSIKRCSNCDYLYEITFTNDLDFDAANEFAHEHFPPITGGCSGFRKGKYHARNFDFPLSESAEFIVKHKTNSDSLEFVGMCAAFDNLTKQVVDSGTNAEEYRWFPYFMYDGINSAGVVAQINMIEKYDSATYGRTTGTHPDAEHSICTSNVVSYILSHCRHASEVITLFDDINIWSPQSTSRNAEYHWLVSDEDNTYLIEIINNEVFVKLLAPDMSIITNFYQKDMVYDPSVASPDCMGGIDKHSVNPHANGIERWETLYRQIRDMHDVTESSIIQAIKSVKWTFLYDEDQDPIWYSDFNGIYTGEPYGYIDLNVDSAESDYTPVRSATLDYYHDHHGERNGVLWQTVHTAIYDIEERKMIVYTQEDYGSNRFERREIDFCLR